MYCSTVLKYQSFTNLIKIKFEVFLLEYSLKSWGRFLLWLRICNKKKLLLHWRFSAMALPAVMVTVGAKLKKSKVLEYWLNDNYNWFCEKREKKEHFKMFQTERLRLIHCTFLLQWMTIFMGVYPFTSRSTVRSHPWYSNCQADEIPGSISATLSVPSQSLPRSGGEARAHFANSSW